MAKIKDIILHLESIAPRAYQESYDNSGLIIGDASRECSGTLISLDCIEAVVDEAIEKGCNLIVSHHPIVFKGLKQITGKNYVERTVIKAIKNDIAIYAIHTNLDNVSNGVNQKIADRLGLQNTSILAEKTGTLEKLVSLVPQENTNEVLESLHQSGAGNIGNYQNCSFRVTGTGTFKPNEEANPHIGEQGEQEEVIEDRIELIYPSHLRNKIVSTLRSAHPYDEAAYFVSALGNTNQGIGSGIIGELENPLSPDDFLQYLKDRMNLNVIRHTRPNGKTIKKVAVCGGAGSFLLGQAKGKNADAFVTADFKYHEFFDAEEKLIICDIGHYESEIYTKDLLHSFLTEKFPNIASYLSGVDTNPVQYY